MAITLLAMASPTWADDHAKAQLLANVSGITPGAPFYVGVKFTIDPGWHIYWKNPGDSGLATDVKLTLPDGFTAGELLFPIPSRIEFPGPVINYGYENEVVLLMKITPPAKVTTTGPLTFAGKVSWLVCDKDNCIPGSADLSISLPVADPPAPDNQLLFDRWISRLPTTATLAGADSVSKSLSLANKSGTACIDLGWKNVPSDIQFIPGPLDIGIISDITAITEKKNTKITFNLRNVENNEPITGLVIFTTEHGDRAGFEVVLQSGSRQ